jgi:hypothetical protein
MIDDKINSRHTESAKSGAALGTLGDVSCGDDVPVEKVVPYRAQHNSQSKASRFVLCSGWATMTQRADRWLARNLED